VRKLLIRGLMPVLLCTLPFLAAALVALCIPEKARKFFIENFGMMEGLIVGGGVPLFLLQMFLSWRALRWRGTSFDEGADRWLSNLAQAAEWFPMLGLIGTVAGILDAFATHGSAGAIQPRVIAPAITATGAGLFMAFINILPTWIVTLGRDFILLLSGTPRPQPSEPEA
jgi:MotA/TolQ/ExbB proton channel family